MKNSKAVVVLAALLASALSLSACTSTATHESTGQMVDSSSITVAVKAKLAADSDISSMKISVSTFKDVVTLHGHVATEHQKHKAVEDAKSVAGVREVRDELMVGGHHHHHKHHQKTADNDTGTGTTGTGTGTTGTGTTGTTDNSTGTGTTGTTDNGTSTTTTTTTPGQ